MNNYNQIAGRITRVLFTQQSLASASFIAAATLNSIVGKELSRQSSFAGVPSAVYLLSGALAAYLWGFFFDLFGRRISLSTGLFLGSIGSLFAFLGIGKASFPLFLIGMVFSGVANAAVLLGRYIAAEVSPPEQRGRAISNVVVGGTVGSIIGPLAAGPVGNFVGSHGFSELSGVYLFGAALLLMAAFVVFLGLKPDPSEIGRQIAELNPAQSHTNEVSRPILLILRQPAAIVALVSMVLGQVVMVLVMVITSLHMRDHDHMLSDISVVVSAHTIGMYAFSVLSGWLSDRWGRAPVIIAGSTALIVACLSATISPAVIPLSVALFLLGLGWNFCYVGGSTLLADQLSPVERARTQGSSDLLVGLASSIGSLESGFIFTTFGFNTMAFLAAGVSVLPLTLTIYWIVLKRKSAR